MDKSTAEYLKAAGHNVVMKTLSDIGAKKIKHNGQILCQLD